MIKKLEESFIIFFIAGFEIKLNVFGAKIKPIIRSRNYNKGCKSIKNLLKSSFIIKNYSELILSICTIVQSCFSKGKKKQIYMKQSFFLIFNYINGFIIIVKYINFFTLFNSYFFYLKYL